MEFVWSPRLTFWSMIFQIAYCLNGVASLLDMTFVSLVNVIVEWILEWHSVCFVSSLNFYRYSTNDGFVWSPWAWDKSSSVEKSWSDDVSFEVLLNSSLFHVPSDNFDWCFGIISDLDLVKSVTTPVVTLLNISVVKVVVDVVMVTKVVCWIDIRSHFR